MLVGMGKIRLLLALAVFLTAIATITFSYSPIATTSGMGPDNKGALIVETNVPGVDIYKDGAYICTTTEQKPIVVPPVIPPLNNTSGLPGTETKLPEAAACVGLLCAVVIAVKNLFDKMKNAVNNTNKQTPPTNPLGMLKNGVVSVVNSAVNAVKNVVNGAKNVVDKAVSGAKTVITNVVNGAKNVVNNIVSGAKSIVNKAVNAAKNTVNKAVAAVKTVVNNVVSGAKTVVNNVVSGAKNLANKAVSTITSLFKPVSVPSVGITIKPPSVSSVVNGAKNLVNNVISGIGGLFGLSSKPATTTASKPSTTTSNKPSTTTSSKPSSTTSSGGKKK